jgi:hypothetical protein
MFSGRIHRGSRRFLFAEDPTMQATEVYTSIAAMVIKLLKARCCSSLTRSAGKDKAACPSGDFPRLQNQRLRNS